MTSTLRPYMLNYKRKSTSSLQKSSIPTVGWFGSYAKQHMVSKLLQRPASYTSRRQCLRLVLRDCTAIRLSIAAKKTTSTSCPSSTIC